MRRMSFEIEIVLFVANKREKSEIVDGRKNKL